MKILRIKAMMYAFVKRLIDIAVALIGLFVLWSVFIVISVLVKLGSDGPVFFVQNRLGKKRKPFSMYKFRTMVKDAEHLKAGLAELNEADGPVFKIEDDPRLTKVGKFLRKTNLDELPQLINVLVGNMSFVGPRPALPQEVDRYDKRWYQNRFEVTPGMVSLYHLRNVEGVHKNFDRWMRWDSYYVRHRSTLLDLYVLASAARRFIFRFFPQQ